MVPYKPGERSGTNSSFMTSPAGTLILDFQLLEKIGICGLSHIVCGTMLEQPLQTNTGEGTGTPLQCSWLEKSHGRRSLVGYSPWGLKESDTTERLHFHFSLSCIGEGDGNPLQCSCLENPREGGAWWAAVYGITQSQTRLKRLSSSSKLIQLAK